MDAKKTWKFEEKRAIYKQGGGVWEPWEAPLACKQTELERPGGLEWAKLIFSSTTFLHGLLLLHTRLTATSDDDLPHMFLYVMSLICTLEEEVCIQEETKETLK